jgi:AraC family transcriptional regulator, regulatory protein of adaptative response / methylated-DNA-[protein]-cysteine methyltransferase
MQRALHTRDRSFDGIFFAAVRTTGVFCRPSCPARKPLPENTEFFASAGDALFAGYRPCRRCRPLEPEGLPSWARELLLAVDEEPEQRFNAAELIRRGIHPDRARRTFLRHFGLSFHAYVRARRMAAALAQIRTGQPVDDVALRHGYESHSGFRAAFGRTFGTSPGRSSDARVILTRMYSSPVGTMILGATGEGVCLLEFTVRRMLERQLRILQKRFGAVIVPGASPMLEQAASELDAYFSGHLREFQVPLIAPGTPFQERVWAAVRAIPYGQTLSYEEIARQIGTSGATRAVGTANGMNRIALMIPCHRVITKDGHLGGYGGGLWRKQRLLELERGSAVSG